jgi:hypothetical protein
MGLTIRRRPIILARFLVAVGLVLFMMIGLEDGLGHSGGTPEVGISIVLLSALLLLAITLGALPLHHGIAPLVLGIGVLVLLGNHFLNFVYGHDWFEGRWYFPPEWFTYVTYSAASYVVAERKGVPLAISTCILIALLNFVLGSIILLPTWGRAFGQEYMWSQLNDISRYWALHTLFWGVLGGVVGSLFYHLGRRGSQLLYGKDTA